MRRTAITLAILGAAVTRPLAPILDARQVTWSLSGLAGQNITALVIDPLTPTTVYAGVLGGGVFKSTDAGGEWIPINNGLLTTEIRALAIDPQTPATLYAGSGGAGLFRTLDAGASWTLLDNVRMNRNFIFDMAVDPHTPSTLYVGGNGESLLKSVDGGTTWFSAGPVSSQAIAIDPLNPTTIYAGTDIAVYKSVDGGASWTITPVQPFSVFDITIDPQTSSTVYVSARPYRSTDTGGVLKSTDGGASWTPLTIGLSEMARAVTIDPVSTSTLYAALVPPGAADANAFRSTDGGESWTAINDGLERVDLWSFAVDAVVTHQIYAATTGGVFVASSDLPRATLVVRKRGMGGGRVTSSPSGIDCESDCSEAFIPGTVVTLTAAAARGSRFLGWSGCDSASGTSCVVTLGADRSVWAAFVGVPFGFPGLPGR
jgi:photosystem II stability/assembly factor-like uncharacterized protein